jgi:hypothetical protein
MQTKKILVLLSAVIFLFSIGCSKDKTDDTTTVNKNSTSAVEKSSTEKSSKTEKSEQTIKITQDDIEEVIYRGTSPLITVRINPKQEVVSEKLKPLYSTSPEYDYYFATLDMFAMIPKLEIGKEFQVTLSEKWLTDVDTLLVGRDKENPLSFGKANDTEYLLDNIKYTVPDNFNSYLYKKEQWTTELETFLQDKINSNLDDNLTATISKVYFLNPKVEPDVNAKVYVQGFAPDMYQNRDKFYTVLICKVDGTNINEYVQINIPDVTINSETAENESNVDKNAFQIYGKYSISNKKDYEVNKTNTYGKIIVDESEKVKFVSADTVYDNAEVFATSLDLLKDKYDIINVK